MAIYGDMAEALQKKTPQKTIGAVPAPAAPPVQQNPWTKITPDNLPSWDNLSNILKQGGYTGSATEDYQYQATAPGDAGDTQTYGGTRLNPAVNDWLTQNNYSIGQQRNGNNYQNALLDASGNPIGQDSYTDKGIGPIKYIVPAFLGAVAGGAGLTALGAMGGGAAGSAAPVVGNGAFLGEGIASGLPAWDAAAASAASGAGGAGAELAGGLAGGLDLSGAFSPLASAGAPIGDSALATGGITNGVVGGGSSILDTLGSGASSLAAFAKANPGIAASAAGGLATLLNGDGGAPPAVPASDAGNAQLVKALTEKLYGPNGSMSGSFDYSSVPGLKTSAGDPNQFNQEASDLAYANATRYLEPQVKQQQQALEARLSEQGFVPGTPGYQQAMQNFMDTNARAYAQARDTATLQGFQQGNTAFSQGLSNANLNNAASRETLAQLLAQRNQPLNELNALKTGEQLGYEKQLGQYNADVASKNSTNQALSQLALALGMYLG